MSLIGTILLCICGIISAYSQILISPQIPPQGLMQKNQLWNILCINNSGFPQYVQIQLSLTKSVSEQPILTGTGRTFLLQKGTTLIRADDVAPVQYQYTSATTAIGAGDWLTAGSYNVCYTLSAPDEKIGTPSAEACLNIDSEPLSPPQLISPADTSIVETNYPGFNWIPPAPAMMFTDLKYELLIVEIKEGQSAYDAIQRNVPIYLHRYLPNPFVLYPSSSKALESGKHYAWQVIAKNGNAYSQKTEAWSFRIKDDSASVVIDSGAFTRMTRGFDAQSYICHGNMRFEYYNETGDSVTTVSIYAIQNDIRTLVDSRKIKLRRGQNFVSLKTGNGNTFKNMQVYLLEINNNRNERWNLKFKYVKKE